MYKVFFNEKKINFTSTGNVTLNKYTLIFNENTSVTSIKKWFGSFIESECRQAFIVHPSPEKVFKKFQSGFTTIHAAGGVVIRNNEILFIFRNEKWDLPKGKVDKGESVENAAIREVQEECGIRNVKIVKPLLPTFHIYPSPYSKQKNDWIFKKTWWFEMKYQEAFDGKPQREENITKVNWFGTKDFDQVLKNTHENLKQLILLYCD